MVDTRDLKSLDPWVMRVQVPLRVIVVDGRLPVLTRVFFPFVSRKALLELSFVPQEKHPRVKTSNLLIPNYHSFAAPSNTRFGWKFFSSFYSFHMEKFIRVKI